MRRPFVLLLASLAASHALNAFDCQKGCPLEGPPVCGEDGVEYLNDCVAFCQVRSNNSKKRDNP